MKSCVLSWSIYDFGTDDDNDNVDEAEPTGAHSSGMMRMGKKTVTCEKNGKGSSSKKLVKKSEDER